MNRRIAPDQIDYTNSLTFETLRRANTMRLPLFKNSKGGLAHSKPDGSDWKLTEWVNATAGEVGEMSEMILLAAIVKGLGAVGNWTKKAERGDVTLDEIRPKIAKEMADVTIYLDLLAFRAGINLGQAVMDKFNEVSERVDVSIRIQDGHTWGVTRGHCTNCGDPHRRVDCPGLKWYEPL